FADMIAAYRGNRKLPSTRSLSKRIQDLTAVPAAKKTRRTKKTAAKTSTSKTAPKVAAADWTEYEKLAMTKAQADGLAVYHVVAKIDPHCTMPIAGRQLIHNALSSVGQVLAARPAAKSPAAARHVDFVLASVQPAEQIAAKGR